MKLPRQVRFYRLEKSEGYFRRIIAAMGQLQYRQLPGDAFLCPGPDLCRKLTIDMPFANYLFYKSICAIRNILFSRRCAVECGFKNSGHYPSDI